MRSDIVENSMVALLLGMRDCLPVQLLFPRFFAAFRMTKRVDIAFEILRHFAPQDDRFFDFFISPIILNIFVTLSVFVILSVAKDLVAITL